MQLSIVIPVYNEEENIVTLVGEIRQAMASVSDYEIIVVDDCSTDGTSAKLKELRTEIPQLRVLRHRENKGQSIAVITGVKNARAAWIATLDGDGQNDPADIPKLLQARDNQADEIALIAGIRQRRQDSWIKRLSSRIANAVRSRLTRDNFPDTGCGIKLFPRRAFLDLPHFDHMHRFLPALFDRQGWSVVGVPVSHRPRQAGVSKYGTFDRLRVGVVDLVGVMWLQHRPCNAVTEEIL